MPHMLRGIKNRSCLLLLFFWKITPITAVRIPEITNPNASIGFVVFPSGLKK